MICTTRRADTMFTFIFVPFIFFIRTWAQDITFPVEVDQNGPRPETNSRACPPEFMCESIYSCPTLLEGRIPSPVHCRLSPSEMGRRNMSGSGVCCPMQGLIQTRNVIDREEQIAIDNEGIAGRFLKIRLPFFEIDLSWLGDAIQRGMSQLSNVEMLERNLIHRKLVTREGTPEFAHSRFFGNNPRAQSIARNGNLFVETARQVADDLRKRKNLNSIEEIQKALPGVAITRSLIQDRCPRRPACDPNDRYRTSDGTCNNLDNPSWGESFTGFVRILPPRYDDGVNSPRTLSSTGAELPSARLVSFTIATERNAPSLGYTHMVMQWGQFVDHDLTFTTLSRSNNGDSLQCCGEEFNRNPQFLHPNCFPIQIPRNDPFYARFRVDCMNFVRSAPAGPDQLCKLGPREQLNQLTHLLDGSMIYGNTLEDQRNLRTFRGGLLKSSNNNGKELLPAEQNGNGFMAGDTRVNEQPGLTTIHSVMLREHNRIARRLSQMHRNWNDEFLYQETRRIMGAEIQHITYNEFLPILLGPMLMKSFDLNPLQGGTHSNNYDRTTNPSIFSSFSTAAFRFHTLIQGFLDLRNIEGDRIVDQFDLSSKFNDPSLLRQRGALDLIIAGLTAQPMQKNDRHFTSQVTNHLFRGGNSAFGLDLVAINIQRSRDHGLAPYNMWRQACGLSRIQNFAQLSDVMPEETGRLLARIYRSVDDIDLYVGGISEHPLKGAIVGPTFGCLVAEQFRRLKVGDRFWYENGNMPYSFSSAQLDQIRRVSMAGLLCHNGDNIQLMQRLAFIQPKQWNSKIRCSDIPQMNLNAWS